MQESPPKNVKKVPHLHQHHRKPQEGTLRNTRYRTHTRRPETGQHLTEGWDQDNARTTVHGIEQQGNAHKDREERKERGEDPSLYLKECFESVGDG